MVSVKLIKLNILLPLVAVILAGCAAPVRMEESAPVSSASAEEASPVKKAVPAHKEVSPFAEREDAYGSLLNEAWVALSEGRWVDADVWLSRAVRINPTNPEIYYHMALLRQQQGQPEQARQLAGRAMSLGPDQSLEPQLENLLLLLPVVEVTVETTETLTESKE